MTINKSQGQSLQRVGLYLDRPVFSHGQLYVTIHITMKYKILKQISVSVGCKHVDLTLSYGLSLNSVLFWVIYMSCFVENQMVSVERIRWFTNITSAAAWEIKRCIASSNWSAHGNIDLRDLQKSPKPVSDFLHIYEDLLNAGVADPCQVSSCALQNAVSIAGVVLITQALLVEKIKKPKPALPHIIQIHMDMEYISLKQISRDKNNSKVKVRVLHMWDAINIANNHDLISLDMVLVDEEDLLVTCNAKIINTNNKYGWYYVACLICKTKVKQVKGVLWCERCRNEPKFAVPSYRIQVQVQDETDTTTFILFDKAAEKIISKTTRELAEMQEEILKLDENNLPKEIPKIIGNEYLFQLHLDEYNLKYGKENYTVSKILEIEISHKQNDSSKVEEHEVLETMSTVLVTLKLRKGHRML
ncbi:hypothetical protein SO802_010743 [Lithocarpus litseifolius]|uniref:Replication factor A C-terminal domain-containing protein n=1 Tax=Lithocarpus litseifolius TaxID=425828 RepID=A0AAW2DJK4_9ROSI